MGIQPHRQITPTLSLVRQAGLSSLHTVQFYLRDSKTGTLCWHREAACSQERAETDREGKPGGLWEWWKCSMSYVYTIQNCRTVHLKWVCFIVGKSYLNKVNFKKKETEYEQRRKQSFLLSVYSFFLCPWGFQGPVFTNSVKILPKIWWGNLLLNTSMHSKTMYWLAAVC